MKTLKLLAMIMITGIVAVSCKKEGPAGPQGAAGTNGTNGTNGNANVTVYGYGTDTLKASNNYAANYYPAGLTSGLVDSSIIVTYYSAYPGEWNMANGYGPSGQYATIQYTYGGSTPALVSVYLRNVDGTGYTGVDVIWDSVRIFVVPANIYKIAKHDKLNYNNYKAVNDYFKAK